METALPKKFYPLDPVPPDRHQSTCQANVPIPAVRLVQNGLFQATGYIRCFKNPELKIDLGTDNPNQSNCGAYGRTAEEALENLRIMARQKFDQRDPSTCQACPVVNIKCEEWYHPSLRIN